MGAGSASVANVNAIGKDDASTRVTYSSSRRFNLIRREFIAGMIVKHDWRRRLTLFRDQPFTGWGRGGGEEERRGGRKLSRWLVERDT